MKCNKCSQQSNVGKKKNVKLVAMRHYYELHDISLIQVYEYRNDVIQIYEYINEPILKPTYDVPITRLIKNINNEIFMFVT